MSENVLVGRSDHVSVSVDDSVRTDCTIQLPRCQCKREAPSEGPRSH